MTDLTDPRLGYQSELDEINADLARRKDIFRQDYEAAKAPRQISRQDAFVQGMMQLAPAILGYAIAEEDGAIAGLQGGTVGASQYLEGVQDRLKQEQEQELGVLSLEQDAIKDLETRRNELRKGVQAAELDEFKFDRTIEKTKSLEEFKQKLKQKFSGITEGQVEKFIESYLEAKGIKREDLTPEDIKNLGDALKTKDGRNFLVSMAQVESNRKKSEAHYKSEERKAADKLKALQVPGLEGEAASNDEAEDIREKQTATAQIEDQMQKLMNTIRYDGAALTGAAYAKQLNLIGGLIRQYKDKFGGGAAFTEMEAKLALIAVPKTWANPMASVTEIMQAGALSHNPIDILKEGMNVAVDEFKIAAIGAGYTVPENYSPLDSLTRVNKGKLSAVKGDPMSEGVIGKQNLPNHKPLSEMSDEEKQAELRRLTEAGFHDAP